MEMQPPHTLELADGVRTQWLESTARLTNVARLELYVKVASRARASRSVNDDSPRIERTIETGMAVRVVRAGSAFAGFASASGRSGESLRWVIERACSFTANVTSATPVEPAEREDAVLDLDPESALPQDAELSDAIALGRTVEWAEAGTTTEVLVGFDGRSSARRRNRFWAMTSGATPRLIARRGFTSWRRLLDAQPVGPSSSSIEMGGRLVFEPEAAAPLVGLLVDAYHGASSEPEMKSVGMGWVVSDEPRSSEGLAGGVLDDAGFRTSSRIFVSRGVPGDIIGGPGTFWRRSYG